MHFAICRFMPYTARMLSLVLGVLLAAVAPGVSPSVVVLDRSNVPLVGASVVFVTSDGARDIEASDNLGRATARSGFMAVRALVSALHCAPAETAVAETTQLTLHLDCSLVVIERVQVATGSAQTLHALPVAASVMDINAIDVTTARTGDALLRALPGMDRDRSNSAFTNYGQLRVSFSGAGNDRGLVLADGVPAQDGFGGQIDWAAYPAADIRRVELLRGAGSALYGAGAVGGVLDLETFAPATARATGTLSLAAGSHGLFTSYVGIAMPLSTKLAASFSAQQQRLSYQDLAPGYSFPGDSPAVARDAMTSLRLRYAASERDAISYGYRAAWDYQQEGRSNYDFWRRLVQHDVRYQNNGSRSQLKITYFTRSAFVTNRADQTPAAPGVLRYTQYVPTTESGASSTWIAISPLSTFELRGDARWIRGSSTQNGSTGLFQSSGSGAQQLGGLAAQETLQRTRLELVAGMRVDEEKTQLATSAARPQSAISPRIALRYDAGKHLALRVSEGTGIRFPFLNELVRGYVIGGMNYISNAALVPERSSSLAGGMDWANEREHIALDFTHTFVSNAIMFRTVSPTEQQRSNVGRTQTDGETLAYMHTIGNCSRVTLSGTSQYARVTSGSGANVGRRLAYIPQQSAALSLDGIRGRTRIGVALAYMGKTYADDLNTEPLGSALVAGAHVSIPITGGASITIDADNVTDARYLSSIDRYGPPSVISIGIRVPLAGAHAPPQCDTRTSMSLPGDTSS